MALYKLALFTGLLATFHAVESKLNLNSQSNLAVYWGMPFTTLYAAAAGILLSKYVPPAVKTDFLLTSCSDTDIDVYQLAFVTRINGIGGVPEVNFANAGDNCTTFDGTNLLHCPEIEEDIKKCQSLGKTILLSLGGATYTEGGFTSSSAAVAGANTLWATFGPVSSSSSTPRPFGTAVVDGFDLDFESTVSNMPVFANQLRTLYAADPSKQYFLTAAPQCPYPDAADGPMLDGAVAFDAIWIQFYNNYCGLQAFVPGASSQDQFNYATWDYWAKNVSKNPTVRIFVGAPGSATAAGSGYVPASTLQGIVAYAKGFASFGGVMVWDASQAVANSGFLDGVRAALGNPASSSSTTTTTTTTTKTTDASTSTTRSTSTTTSPKTTTSTSSGMTTTTKSTTTTTTTTPTSTSTSCPVAGGQCSSGSSACSGTAFALCDNGRWVLQSCAAGLVCLRDNGGVYCGYASASSGSGSGSATSCS
ncbi:putative class III chitinase [Aspergillus clavatus NRRL 1]|uniref:chitinase n=1 Tax=Aspergillus clavatus (strain ATCC 1007 / CBS 513.65 / DSM 816 / NCTC 3887 / NRRL 1 / QM 1276 / 107) TaxID=344612 RepID=A1CDJ2_ASPCL|nr:glycosyl hydrolase, family 18, putative [Aspergillus clavatus NRRL 1]EAW11919.1 glycosyl hydrolase, family 18, putative [Aspergillus clavatus NRRL 1]